MSYEKRLKKSRLFGIKNRYSAVIQSYRIAHIGIGINCIYEEMTEPRMLKIPIPFLDRDYYFIRYKKIIPSKFYDRIRENINKRIFVLEQEIQKNGDRYGFVQSFIDILKEVRDG